MRRRRALALMVFGLALAGCSRVDSRVVVLGPPLRARPANAPVRVFRRPMPALGAREVALLEVTGYSPGDSEEELLPSLEELVRAAGGNALVIMRVDQNAGFLRVVASALSLD